MIKYAIAEWDGKSKDVIINIYERFCLQTDFIPQLIQLISQQTYQKGATWLLKHYFELGGKLEQKQVNTIYSNLHLLQNWESKLHILQCIPYMTIVEAEKKNVESFLRNCLIDSNKFVRAWTYNGFYELSIQYPEYQKETKQFFEMAMRDEAASVKARIRNILKKEF